jgi:hypothetical protein
MTAPLWSRVLFRFSRALCVLDVSQQIVRDELLFAFLEPAQRGALTLDAYSKNSKYLPGGEVFSAGLFSWESALLDHSSVPRSGAVLLAAAGGGRELQALLQRGYEVYAFEPVAPLLESARAIAQGAKATVMKATYRDLVEHVRGCSGPLDGLRGPFDLCVLGWGSLSHLTEPDEVVAVLRALRTLAPRAPVMTSFFVRRAGPTPTGGGARKLRRFLRRALGATGGHSVAPGLQFLNSAGFMYAFTRDELLGLCDRAGYAVAHFNDSDYAHALLVPKEASPTTEAA